MPAVRIVRLVVLFVAATGLWSSSALAHPIVAGFERFYAGERPETQLAAGGLLLLNELNCVACHAVPDAWREQLPGRGKISLTAVGDRLSSAALREFAGDPQRLKPGTLMPRLAANDVAGTEAVAAYLTSLRGNSPPRTLPPGDATRGARLFAAVGCAACHAPGDAKTTYASVPLRLAARYDRNALVAFLQDPLHTRPAGRMPAIDLTEGEAADLAAHLQAGRSADPIAKAVATGSARPDGRAAFAARNCAACHDDGQGATVRMSKPLAQVRPGSGCLAPQPPVSAPDFSLSVDQMRALTAALRLVQGSSSPTFTAEQRVSARLEQLNCYACHEWRGRGGVEAVRAESFSTADSAAESLGELGRLPPKLDQAGRKLTSAWLEKLLWAGGGGVRPYLTVRMPRIGREAAGDLVAVLGEACRPATPQVIDTSGTLGHQRFATGLLLIGTGKGGIGCVACHGLGERNPPGVRAINLSHTAKRIRPEYFKALLLDPQGMQPGTIMPPLLASRKGAEKEIESLWTYLKEFDQSPRLPEGLAVAGAFELKPAVEGRPIVFRTFLEGAGTHAIAVGYPTGVHVAFDAYEVRWGVVWRGGFLDAMANWEERTMPPVKPLGDSKKMFSPRMPLAQLRSAVDPWPVACGAEAGYVFKGYRLGTDGVPVLRYRIGAIDVEDVVRPDEAGTGLRRVLTVRGAGENWFYRGLGDDAATRPLVWKNGVAIIEEAVAF